MHQMRLNPQAAARKCAKVVGEVMGGYHPHGDASIYDALVRLAQDFSQRYPLVDGQGNFGNIDGDNAAAMRYTECKLTAAAVLLMEGIDQDSVDFKATYDDQATPPSSRPMRRAGAGCACAPAGRPRTSAAASGASSSPRCPTRCRSRS